MTEWAINGDTVPYIIGLRSFCLNKQRLRTVSVRRDQLLQQRPDRTSSAIGGQLPSRLLWLSAD
jgi:hypothetical protein